MTDRMRAYALLDDHTADTGPPERLETIDMIVMLADFAPLGLLLAAVAVRVLAS